MSDSTGIRTVAVANQAGSAGKTTTVVTLAGLLAEAGARVMVVDLDGQANATMWLGLDPDTVKATAADVMLRHATLESAVQDTTAAGVRIVPSNYDVDAAAVELGRVTGHDHRLRLALADLTDVDVVLIDCPGSLSVMTISALVAATSVVTVTAPSPKELAGIPRLEETIADVAEALNPQLTLGGIVPCIVPTGAGALYTQALAMLTEAYGDLVTPAVRRSVRAPEAYSHQATLSTHAPKEAITGDYRAVLAQLQARGVLP